MKRVLGREIRLVEGRASLGEPWDNGYPIIEDDKYLGIILPSTGDIYVRDSELAGIIKQQLEQMKQDDMSFKFKVSRYKLVNGNEGFNFKLRPVCKRKKAFDSWPWRELNRRLRWGGS